MAAANVLEFGKLSVQCETDVHNAVRVVMFKSVCFGRNTNTQPVEQSACCSHLSVIVVTVKVEDSN